MARDRTRQCIKEVFTGNLNVAPVLLVSLYTYIAGTRQNVRAVTPELASHVASIYCKTMDMVRDEGVPDPGADRLPPPQISQTPIVDLFSHACVFGMGACTRYDYIYPTALWCAGCFFVVRAHEAMGAMGRALLSTERFDHLLYTLRWMMTVLFFCLDAPSGPFIAQPTRLFAHFATGILAYRLLFQSQTRTDKFIDVTLCAADAAGESLATYCFLALRVMSSEEVP